MVSGCVVFVCFTQSVGTKFFYTVKYRLVLIYDTVQYDLKYYEA